VTWCSHFSNCTIFGRTCVSFEHDSLRLFVNRDIIRKELWTSNTHWNDSSFGRQSTTKITVARWYIASIHIEGIKCFNAALLYVTHNRFVCWIVGTNTGCEKKWKLTVASSFHDTEEPLCSNRRGAMQCDRRRNLISSCCDISRSWISFHIFIFKDTKN
jgi:hypothetical protein